MGELVDLRAVRDARSPEEEPEYDPHIEGPAKCLACCHEWHAVARTGEDAVDLVCPKCDTRRGQFQYPAGVAEDTVLRVCNHCDSKAFAVVLVDETVPGITAKGERVALLHETGYKRQRVGVACYGCGVVTDLEDV